MLFRISQYYEESEEAGSEYTQMSLAIDGVTLWPLQLLLISFRQIWTWNQEGASREDKSFDECQKNLHVALGPSIRLGSLQNKARFSKNLWGGRGNGHSDDVTRPSM